jgi:hypothetical protein
LRSLRQSLPGLAKKGEKFFTFILKTSKFLQCKMAVQENKQSPIENLALVIKNWGESGQHCNSIEKMLNVEKIFDMVTVNVFRITI